MKGKNANSLSKEEGRNNFAKMEMEQFGFFFLILKWSAYMLQLHLKTHRVKCIFVFLFVSLQREFIQKEVAFVQGFPFFRWKVIGNSEAFFRTIKTLV